MCPNTCQRSIRSIHSREGLSFFRQNSAPTPRVHMRDRTRPLLIGRGLVSRRNCLIQVAGVGDLRSIPLQGLETLQEQDFKADCHTPLLLFRGFQLPITGVRSNYVDCQEYSGLKSSPFLSIALRIVSTLCIQATKATFFSFPAASSRS